MIRDIITDKTLLEAPSQTVDDDEDITELVEDLIDTAEHWRPTKVGCLGLAANQIGYNLRVIVIWETNHWMVMVNPNWEPRDGLLSNQHEQCLSRPSVNVKVKRHKRILCEWRGVTDLEYRTAKYSHLTARIIQHEVDHLTGIYIGR